MLVDSHCHLDFPEFEDQLDDIVTRAREAGVEYMVTICTRVTKFEPVLAVANQFPNIACTVGIHPHNVESEPEITAQHLIKMAERQPKVIGLGETGLDFFYNKSPHEDQERAFRAHIEASRHTGLPIIVHTRDAEEDTIRILRDEYGKGPFTGLIHCFSGGHELAKASLELGFYISISGIATFKKADALRDVIKTVPVNRILVETDAPYLAPVPRRGKTNEPAYTAHTAACVAELMEMELSKFNETTTENFFRLFTKAASVFNVQKAVGVA